MKQLLIFFLFTCIAFHSRAQGIGLVPLKDNEAQKAQYMLKRPARQTMSKTGDTLKLPFLDDFSYVDKYLIDPAYNGKNPFDSFWVDHNVFINSTMADSPPSIGVATFDGLNEQGLAYNKDAGRASSDSADMLTSQPINMSVLRKGDSTVYFSFYYQPQGLGVAPKPEDSLTVQFKVLSYDTNHNAVYTWKNVWSKPGQAIGTSTHPFRTAIIRVQDTFFYNNFQFRFMNYANLNGNLNHWNIDYVYLNNRRAATDTFFKDVALSNLPNSVLNNYYAMPAHQFFAGDIRAKLRGRMKALAINNFNATSGNNNFGYDCYNLNNSKLFAIDTTGLTNSQIIEKFSSFLFTPLFSSQAKVSIPPTDSIAFRTKYKLVPPNALNTIHANDISYRTQAFTNYYAYDDGTAEAGFGLINVQQGSVAVKYPMQQDTDVVQGVLIHFNQSETDVTGYNFSLVVWSDLDLGKLPKDTHPKVIKQLDNLTPRYVNWPNGYAYFPFDQPVPVFNYQFYVGWTQNANFVLNVGFDRNYDEITDGLANPNLFYNVDGSWAFNSDIHGALMIRPVMGRKPFTGMDMPTTEKADIGIFPNPSSGIFNINLPDAGPYELSLYDMHGRLLSSPQKLSGSNTLDYSGHIPGMYLLKVSNTKETSWRKLVIR
jgi:hypothetical protein